MMNDDEIKAAAQQYKQETCPETVSNDVIESFIAGAKYKKNIEDRYSKEEMLNFAWYVVENVGQTTNDISAHFDRFYLNNWEKIK